MDEDDPSDYQPAWLTSQPDPPVIDPIPPYSTGGSGDFTVESAPDPFFGG